MSNNVNRTFNNQVDTDNPGTYIFTASLKRQIVKQLAGKTPEQQEDIIETLLKMLDVNLLASLYMAYGSAAIGEKKETGK